MVVIGIIGEKRHGKDTIANYLVKKYSFEKKTLAGPLKEICRILFGFNNEQLYGNLKEDIDEYWNVSPRKMYQFIGTDLFRKQFTKICPQIKDRFWIEIVKKQIIDSTANNIVLSDIRFPNEVDLVDELNGINIKVVRPSIKSKDLHESETKILSIKNYDYIVINNGTINDLHNKIDNIINNLD